MYLSMTKRLKSIIVLWNSARRELLSSPFILSYSSTYIVAHSVAVSSACSASKSFGLKPKVHLILIHRLFKTMAAKTAPAIVKNKKQLHEMLH